MQPVPLHLIERFAEAFAYQRNGFALKDITPFFERYESGLPSSSFDGIVPKKGDHFVNVVSNLSPRNQRYALFDLCCNPPNLKGCPDEEKRVELLESLLSADGKSPISLCLSRISLRGVREQWWTAASRIQSSPSAAVTAGRSIVETTCKTIVEERGQTADTSGDLHKLFKQARDVLSLATGKSVPKSLNELVSGLVSVVNALATISNNAGDRHGLSGGSRLEDTTIAGITVQAAGVLSYALVQIYIQQYGA